ncbi:MAG: hypothetical protein ACYS8K_10350, partial [Planctomycetota bacterium]
MATSGPKAESIQAQISRLEQAKEIDEAVRSKALGAYKQALSNLKVARDWEAKAKAFAAAAAAAPAKLAEAKKRLALVTTQPAATAPADATTEQIQQWAAKAAADAAAAKKYLADIEAESTRRAARRLAVPKLASAAEQRITQLDSQLAGLPKGSPAEVDAATRMLLEAEKEALGREAEVYRGELAAYDAERALLTVNTELAGRLVSLAQARLKGLQKLLDKKRQEDAARVAKEAEDAAIAAANSHPLVRALAEENAALAARRTGPNGVATKIPRVTKRLDEVIERLTRLQQDLQSLVEKEKAVGGTVTFGVLLRKAQSDLPDVDDLARQAKARQAEIAATHLLLIELQDQQKKLADSKAAARRVLAEEPAARALAGPQRERVYGAALALLEARQKIIAALIPDCDAYFAKLVDLDVKASAVLAKTEEMEGYIGERVLWIRSAGVLSWQDVPRAAEAAQWIVGPKAWSEVAMALARSAARGPITGIVGVLVFLALLTLRVLSSPRRPQKQG